MTRLDGEVAIVTGASSGIGAATAQMLAARGVKVVLAARRTLELGKQVRAIASKSGTAIALPTDVTDGRQIANLAHHTLAHFGRVDILVNCAGIGMAGPLARLRTDEIHGQLTTNLLGPILLTRAILPGMIARRRGAIISVSSLAGHLPFDPLYSASKFGLRAFSFALHRQLRGSGVSASVVSPGFIRTAMTEGTRKELPGPEYVAYEIIKLVLTPRREAIVPRRHQLSVWVERLFPWAMDRLLRHQMGEGPGATNSMSHLRHIRRCDLEQVPCPNEPGTVQSSE